MDVPIMGGLINSSGNTSTVFMNKPHIGFPKIFLNVCSVVVGDTDTKYRYPTAGTKYQYRIIN